MFSLLYNILFYIYVNILLYIYYIVMEEEKKCLSVLTKEPLT